MNTKVFVYFNLHKKCFSIKSLKTGRVIQHSNEVTLENCQFKVTEAGRQRVLKQKRKNVHAGVVGYITSSSEEVCDTEVRYNPYKYMTFVKSDEQPIFAARKVVLSAKPKVSIKCMI